MNSIFQKVVQNPISDLSCPIDSNRQFSYGDLTSLFLFLSSHVGVEGFISNISLGSSYGWYFKVTQFELIFLSLLMLQLFVLRYIEILPINMNNLFVGDPSGRRKRRGLIHHKVCRKDELAESLLRVLRKLDDGQCIPFALCELQQSLLHRNHKSYIDFHLPHQTQKLIEALKLSGQYREENLENCKVSTALTYFEEAVALGDSEEYSNGTICQGRFHACPLTSQDVIHYVRTLTEADMLS